MIPRSRLPLELPPPPPLPPPSPSSEPTGVATLWPAEDLPDSVAPVPTERGVMVPVVAPSSDSLPCGQDGSVRPASPPARSCGPVLGHGLVHGA